MSRPHEGPLGGGPSVCPGPGAGQHVNVPGGESTYVYLGSTLQTCRKGEPNRAMESSRGAEQLLS